MATHVTIQTNIEKGRINRNIYGHFSEHLGRCIYEGIWVGEDSPIPNTRGIRNDVLAALKQIRVPVLRWPGGCFADEYHWKDGVGPLESRKTKINTHWGGVLENNHFGTHEFLLLCELLECEPYICGNVGSGTVQEMSEWVEYMTFDGVSPMADWHQYDPEKRVGLIVDEWGTWHDVEPGTNPGFLYQQNTMRDAVSAGIHFHIFHEHCDRVEMANMAQVVNVLQSVILTEGERMLLPTMSLICSKCIKMRLCLAHIQRAIGMSLTDENSR